MSSSLQRAYPLRKTSTAPSAARAQPAPPAGEPSRPSNRAGPTRIASAKTTATTTATTTSLRSGGRPNSTLTGRSASSTVQRRHAELPRRDPSAAAPARLPAKARPTSAGGVTSAAAASAAQPRHGPAHARAKSTATAGLHPRHPATALRPSSRDGTRLTSAAVTRSGTAPAAVDAAARPSTPPSVAAAAPPLRLRPAFSTMQQHYSPARNLAPKPLTSTYLAPPSPFKLPANIAASAEISRLQAELLQLHLLHRDAAPAFARWQASARDKLGRRFVELAGAGRALAQGRRADAERASLLALRRWGGSGKGLDEKMQLLGDVLSGLWALDEPGGRYARAVRRFERWADGVRGIEEARVGACTVEALAQSQGALFIDELDMTWKDETTAMTRRLRDWQSKLDEIDDLVPPALAVAQGADTDDDGEDDATEEPRGGSSLERMLAGAQILAQGMLSKLAVVEDLEREARAREDEWVEKMNRDEAADTGPATSAVWRTV